MRHWVLGEDKEVTEHYQVSRDEPGVGMTKQVSTAAGLRTTLFFLVTPFISCGLKQDFLSYLRGNSFNFFHLLNE